MSYIYSGVCLAAMFGAIFYESYLIKKEEAELCAKMRALAEKAKSEYGDLTPVIPPKALPADATHIPNHIH
ncbi:MAG: hypothetical protein LBS60_15550 [Deltaproteobacteria bacterium]|jgi:hypothetical protein|nr:hypothetical protein [Deltaproteobacteria bacterium]